MFIIGIKFLSSPKTARIGNLIAAAGMLIALFALHKPDGESVWSQGWSFNYTLIAIGTVIGLIIGAIGAYSVKMTAMPQMVAMFNGLGGGAAALVASLEFCAARTALEGITAFHRRFDAVRHAHRLALVFRQHHRVSETGGKI